MPNTQNSLKFYVLLQGYEQGLFPMADGANLNSPIHWYYPERRAVLRPLGFHVPRRLTRFLRGCPWTIRWNDDFRAVMTACGDNRSEGTWINPVLVDAFTALFDAGHAYCLSVFDGHRRIGGLYGVTLGGVYTAESMFSRASNASSVALTTLMAGLAKAGVEIVDVQYANAHTRKFGIDEISHDDYLAALTRFRDKTVDVKADYFSLDEARSFVQSLTQTS
jgi:leucyl/phenylalanyl-tRNA---protein transferase